MKIGDGQARSSEGFYEFVAVEDRRVVCEEGVFGTRRARRV